MRTSNLNTVAMIATAILIFPFISNAQIIVEPMKIGMDTVQEKTKTRYCNLAFAQTAALEVREAEIGYGINFKGISSLDVSVGMASGFFLDANKTTAYHQRPSRAIIINHHTVKGYGKYIALNHYHDFSLPEKSGIYQAISIKMQQFNSIRDPKNLTFNDYTLSMDNFNARVASISAGIGYKYQFDKSSIRVGLAWQVCHTSYEGTGTQFGTSKHSKISSNEEIYYNDQFVKNTINLKVSFHQ